jgi:hypothetical protein
MATVVIIQYRTARRCDDDEEEEESCDARGMLSSAELYH